MTESGVPGIKGVAPPALLYDKDESRTFNLV